MIISGKWGRKNSRDRLQDQNTTFLLEKIIVWVKSSYRFRLLWSNFNTATSDWINLDTLMFQEKYRSKTSFCYCMNYRLKWVLWLWKSKANATFVKEFVYLLRYEIWLFTVQTASQVFKKCFKKFRRKIFHCQLRFPYSDLAFKIHSYSTTKPRTAPVVIEAFFLKKILPNFNFSKTEVSM